MESSLIDRICPTFQTAHVEHGEGALLLLPERERASLEHRQLDSAKPALDDCVAAMLVADQKQVNGA